VLLDPNQRGSSGGGSWKPPSAASPAEAETGADRLDRVRAVFQEMKRQYASGNFTRYGELLQLLEKLLSSP